MPADSDVPTTLPLDTWLAKLAAPEGNPGGGSAAGIVLAVGAALVHMVCEYTGDEPLARELSAQAARLREESLRAARADGAVSKRLGEALALSAGEDREHRLREAALEATASSVTLARVALRLSEVMERTADVGARALIADTAVAADALAAGLGACLTNIRANVALARRHGADDAALDTADQVAVSTDAERLRMRALADRIRPA